ncbi:MAG: TlpA family protein disulfide reductase [Oscillibacter sp.]|nr:TlpA family protein disulfide reductase [Oscillibacter sp.]
MRTRIILPLAALALILSVSGFLYGQLLSTRYKINAPTVPVTTVQTEESASDADTSDESAVTDADTTVESAVTDADESAGTDTDKTDAIAAPDFSMLNADGESVRLSDFLGMPVVLNFWATWCPPCRGELPYFDEAYAEYGERVAFLMTDLTDGRSETIEGAQAFVTEQGYAFPVRYDTELEGAYAYGVNAIPATYFINADGTIHSYQIGALDRETLYDRLEKLLE